MKYEPSDECKRVAAILADWFADRAFTVYFYGSRVRADHRPDSDVDFTVDIGDLTQCDLKWITEQIPTEFAELSAKLGARVHWPKGQKNIEGDVIAAGKAQPYYSVGNVVCVWMKPKPPSRIAPEEWE